MGNEKPKPSREALRVKLDAHWQDAMKRAIEKPKPAGGWPERQKQKRRTSKSNRKRP
ncbi:MAG: hypothetical protein WEF50_15980 [Myxococcota bacterium]